MNSPAKILNLWLKAVKKHEDKKTPAELSKTGQEQKLKIKKGITTLKLQARADVTSETGRTKFLQLRDRAGKVMTKYCRFLKTGKDEDKKVLPKYLLNVKKLTALVLKLNPEGIDLSEDDADLDGLSVDVGELEKALSQPETDGELEAEEEEVEETASTTEEETPKPPTPQTPPPTLGKVRNQLAELIQPYKLAEGRKAPEMPQLKLLFDKAQQQLTGKEYGEAEKTLVLLKKLLDKSESDALGKGKSPPSSEGNGVGKTAPPPSGGQAKVIKLLAALSQEYKDAESRKAPEFLQMKALFDDARDLLGKKEFGDAEQVLQLLDQLLKKSKSEAEALLRGEKPTAPVSKEDQAELFKARLKKLARDLPLAQGPDSPVRQKVMVAMSEVNTLARKNDFGAALELLKTVDALILEAKRAVVKKKGETRVNTALKDRTVATSYLEKAGKLDTKGALAQRRKLLALRSSKNTPITGGGTLPSGQNVLGLLNEVPLRGEDAGRRLNTFQDRLSQSGSTMAEYASAGRLSPEGLRKLVESGEKTVLDLQERLKTADEDDALLLNADLEEAKEGLQKLKAAQGKSKGGTPKPVKVVSKEEARENSKKRFNELLTKKDGPWKEDRTKEVGRTVDAQDKKVKALEEKLGKLTEDDPTRPNVAGELNQAKKDLEALKKDQSEIQATLDNWPAALNDFREKGGRWGKTKKAARGGGTPEETAAAGRAMKAARWIRQEFMDDALQNTAVRFLEKSAVGMGIDPEDMEIEELPPSDDPKGNSQYLDGRARRCRLKIKPPKSEQYGESLTVFCFAPGSTEDTSDIDMQFIVEENPTAATELIKTFQEVSAERMEDLKGTVGEGSLAEIFDVNPYPAGFVYRDELGSDLHFSDTYTERSMDAKKSVDGGLALIRRLETPPTIDGKQTDPIEDILASTAGDPIAEDNQLRSLRTGVDVALRSQHDRAAALLKQFPGAPEGAEAEFKALQELVEGAAKMNKAASWSPAESWSGPTLPKKDLQDRLAQSHKIEAAAKALAEALDKKQAGSGKAAVAKARTEVYLQCQEEVEKLTQARDLALVEGVEAVQQLEAEISKAGATRETHKELFEKYDAALEQTRAATSAIGTAAFLAQGMALHNADEAFFNRGAIGHVVEEQMGRDFLKTTGSAISSLEANAGFILEHFAHDHAEDSPEELASFAMAVGKYIERMAKAFESIDARVVDTKGPHAWIKALGASMSLLKKGKDPATNGFLEDPKRDMGKKILEALGKAGIGSLKELQKKLEQVVADAWQAYHAAQ